VSDLFRKEAITHATRRLNGEVVLATPVSFRIIAFLAVVAVVGAVLFVATASYARKETVVGWLTPDAGMVRLSARQGGVVETAHVREGDAVVVGQPVATLRLSSALTSGDASVAWMESRAADAGKWCLSPISCPSVTLSAD
jgi:membrane fusion protein